MIKVGEQIPDFEIDAYIDNDIKKVMFGDYKNKWLVLLFYPADFTFVCPTELRDAAEHEEQFQKENAQLLSISTDTAYVHKAWHDESEAIGKVKYPMLADPTGAICRAFGTYDHDEGMSIRATYIIDPDGYVRAMEMHDNSIGRNIREILRKLQASKFVSEHDGLACPANWQPGDETLKPSTDLVGKI